MFKLIYKLLRRVVLSFGLLYAFNILFSHFNLPIPINIGTLSITTILGVPGFLGLIIFYIINFR